MRSVCSLLLACSLFACQSKHQSTQSAMKIICNAPTECTSCSSKDRDTRDKQIALHIVQHVSNVEIKEMWKLLAAAPMNEQSIIVQRESKKIGLSQCPLAVEWASR